MTRKKIPYSPEFREAAVWEVVDRSRSGAEVARELGVNPNTLWSWVTAYRRTQGTTRVDSSPTDQARIKELERRVGELEQENDFLAKASAFFAKKHR
ncbi:transposase [Nocardia panacis]|uniref:transposase n=1 Tax=Nocardia panacis TaxID=2340916 RepID=UPI0013158D39|nr:transposase [Nocardia panacis]